MWEILISALLNLLIFFFEQWWEHNHAVRPDANTKMAFIAEVGSFRHILLGPKRKRYAAKIFDKFLENYDANPPKAQSQILDANQAKSLASQYALGITLSPDEV